MWQSKLGGTYLKSDIEKNEQSIRAKLNALRNLPENQICADCGSGSGSKKGGSGNNVWASVNLGVFLCLHCGSIHRGVGTHITVPKGCTGTYFWGPDEIERMESVGNARAREWYGGGDDCVERPTLEDSDDVWQKFVVDKYVHRKFASSMVSSSAGGGGGVSNVREPSKEKKDCALFPSSNLGAVRKKKTKKKRNEKRKEEIDLMSFDDELFPNRPNSQRPSSSFNDQSSKSCNDDFFSQYGV